MKTLTFDLLAKHVTRGMFSNIRDCPIARAIREQLAPESFHVLYEEVRIDNARWTLSTPYYREDYEKDLIKYDNFTTSGDEVVRTYTLTLQ